MFSVIWIIIYIATIYLYFYSIAVTTSQPRRPTTINDVFDKTTQSLVISTDKGDLVTDVVEPMTTHIPPITQGLVDGCQDLSGQWSSKHTSERLALNHNEDDSVDGLYNSCANCGWLGVEGRKATRESTLGLLVIGQGGDVVISWAGMTHSCFLHNNLKQSGLTNTTNKNSKQNVHIKKVHICLIILQIFTSILNSDE